MKAARKFWCFATKPEKWAVLSTALILTACATPAPPPEPRIVTKEVQVVVQVKCKPNLPPRPDYPDTDAALAAAPNIFVAVQLYKAGRKLRIAREGQQDAALKACAG